ncbi:MAG: 50S ribosomal protein L23 [Myxococcales bacterium]|nr:50S ribosomal protein L23 [Myxococcales bacterium]
MRPAHEILLRPRLTEKASAMSENASLVVFEVPLDANKSEIKNAVQAMFNVEVDSVRTMVVRGKIKRRGRHQGQQSNWKKALVKLVEGQELDVFSATAG